MCYCRRLDCKRMRPGHVYSRNIEAGFNTYHTPLEQRMSLFIYIIKYEPDTIKG